MKKLFHILTIRDHRKLMVEPGKQWAKEVSDRKYHKRFGSAVGPGQHYPWSVYDGGMEIARFTNMEDSEQFEKQRNAEFPPLPKPPAPPPFPFGTYYMLEAVYYEIRQIVRETKTGVQEFTVDGWQKPYRLVRGREAFSSAGRGGKRDSWQEKFIAKYDDREQALAHLRRLVYKKQHEPLVKEGAIPADDEQEGKR
jgi:hypothetical protein